MRKTMMWLFAISLIICVIDWGVVGLRILNGNYDITVGAYIALACTITMMICALYRRFNMKCPHCGRLRTTGGAYCPFCGSKIE